MTPRIGGLLFFLLCWLILLILAGVFPSDAFKTLYDFDHFVIFAFETNTF